LPIQQTKVFKCIKCGYKETRTVGDNLPDMSSIKPCPKCGNMMKPTDSSVKNIFGKIFGGF